ncbi:MAG: winged helix-turn-helix domain-containing protein [Thermofilaceae archaeon]
MPATKRCRHEILAEILEYLSASGRAKLTWIASYANMPLDRARILLGEMMFYGLVELFEDENGERYYRCSKRGLEYLELWRKLQLLSGR